MKLFYHQIIKEKLDWDEVILIKFEKNWSECLLKLNEIYDLKIPRAYCKQNYKYAELHAFGDAGQEMLLGVIYAKFYDENDNYISHKIIFAKTYIVSHKEKRTIPENELQIAT